MPRNVTTGQLTNQPSTRDVNTGQLVNVGQGTPKKQTFTGNGSQTSFPLAFAPIPDSELVFVSGSQSASAAYSIVGTNLVFTAAPSNGAAIQIAYWY